MRFVGSVRQRVVDLIGMPLTLELDLKRIAVNHFRIYKVKRCLALDNRDGLFDPARIGIVGCRNVYANGDITVIVCKDHAVRRYRSNSRRRRRNRIGYSTFADIAYQIDLRIVIIVRNFVCDLERDRRFDNVIRYALVYGRRIDEVVLVGNPHCRCSIGTDVFSHILDFKFANVAQNQADKRIGRRLILTVE